MSNETRNRIAYWFFLVMGMAGVSFQMYEFFTGHIDFEVGQIAVTALFSVFIFRPTVLVDLFKLVKGLGKKEENE